MFDVLWALEMEDMRSTFSSYISIYPLLKLYQKIPFLLLSNDIPCYHWYRRFPSRGSL